MLKRIFIYISLIFAISLANVSRLDAKGEDNVADSRINTKINSLALIGILNPAVEFKVMEKFTVQMEALGSFYTYNFLGTQKPLVLGMCFGEFRYYPKKAFSGFFVSPNLGFSVFKINKGLVLGYRGTYDNDSYQQGHNFMAGLTLGYQWNIGKHWSLEFVWGGGYQHSIYHGFSRENNSDPYLEYYIGRNASAEWLTLYKGGLFVGYRF